MIAVTQNINNSTSIVNQTTISTEVSVTSSIVNKTLIINPTTNINNTILINSEHEIKRTIVITDNTAASYYAYIAKIYKDQAEQYATSVKPIGVGFKSSSVDAGILNEMSVDDDYLYICVQGGSAGSAIWKKSLLFKT
jgi:hypothetical protein